MRRIPSKFGWHIWLHEWRPDDPDLVLPFPMPPDPEADTNSPPGFVCLLVISSRGTPPEHRERLCRRIVALGCRHVTTWGYEPGEWDYEIMRIGWEINPDALDEKYVYSWILSDESIDDAVFCTFLLTGEDSGSHTRYLILIIGHDPMITEEVERCIPHPA